MSVGLENAHVGADLGQDLGGGRLLDSRNGADQLPRLTQGCNVGLDLLLDRLNLALQKVDVLEREADHLDVVRPDPALDGRHQCEGL